MKVSQLFFQTLREVPAEAEIVSHQLLLRAGMIRKSAAGVYTYMPLGLRVIQKIMTIVREEMDRAGGQEVLLPIIQPAELWLESGRWHIYGKELFRLKDRHERDFCLGPTHEEIITDLVRGEVKSYKQLPQLLYQIQNKYRDERRPRFGLMRGREFIMKDLYSFDRDEAGLDVSYQKMYQAYTTVFKRCGLDCRPVAADSGAIGGNITHEFMVLAEAGEARVVYCNSCNYAANVEIAPCRPVSQEKVDHPGAEPLTLVHTPDCRTIEEVSNFLKLPPTFFIKTLIYLADDKPVVVVLRGDREVNEVKLKKVLDCITLELADDRLIKQHCGVSAGFVGPVGLKLDIYADLEIPEMSFAITGANQPDYHYLNVRPGQDFSITKAADLRIIESGEPCPECGAILQDARGIEVGQVFKLGTKYSQALEAKYLDEKGKEQLMVMGCYGIGISRTMAAAVEQNHDEHGIIWPFTIAPYHVIVVPVSWKDDAQRGTAEEIYRSLLDRGVEALLDDRDERPGVKFKDADLIGFPLRVTVGGKTLQEGKVEVKLRRDKEFSLVAVNEITDHICRILQENGIVVR